MSGILNLMLARSVAAGGTPAAWNPSAKGSSASLSVSDTKLTVGAASQTTRATGAKSSGKWYAEFIGTVAVNGAVIGVANASVNLSDYPGADANFWGIYYDGRKVNAGSFPAYGSGYAVNDVVGIALDMDNGKLFYRLNGTWQGSGDPVAGTNAVYTGLTGSLMIAGGSASTASLVWTGNWGQSAFAASAPSGYSAWTA